MHWYTLWFRPAAFCPALLNASIWRAPHHMISWVTVSLDVGAVLVVVLFRLSAEPSHSHQCACKHSHHAPQCQPHGVEPAVWLPAPSLLCSGRQSWSISVHGTTSAWCQLPQRPECYGSIHKALEKWTEPGMGSISTQNTDDFMTFRGTSSCCQKPTSINCRELCRRMRVGSEWSK